MIFKRITISLLVFGALGYQRHHDAHTPNFEYSWPIQRSLCQPEEGNAQSCEVSLGLQSHLSRLPAGPLPLQCRSATGLLWFGWHGTKPRNRFATMNSQSRMSQAGRMPDFTDLERIPGMGTLLPYGRRPRLSAAAAKLTYRSVRMPLAAARAHEDWIACSLRWTGC
jgi:hypothetical protein